MKYRALICDLDMTVIDSRRDIADAVATVVREHNETVLDPAQIIPWIGCSLWKLFAGLVPGADPATVQQLVDRYKRHFYDHCADQTTIYPGVREVLALLGQRNLPRAIATTKMTFMAQRVCEVLGLVPYFEHIQGTDGFPEKPDPTVLLKTCEALAISPREAVIVGDTVMDIRAAKAAGGMAVAVTYGIGRREDLAAAEPDLLIDDFFEVGRLFV